MNTGWLSLSELEICSPFAIVAALFWTWDSPAGVWPGRGGVWLSLHPSLQASHDIRGTASCHSLGVLLAYPGVPRPGTQRKLT